MRFFSRTPVRTFVIYPAIALVWELAMERSQFQANLWFLPLMLWGYLQYRLCGRYRVTRGGGGPGVETPPERLVTTGLYRYTRNPMYLGHMIFLIGLTLTLKILARSVNHRRHCNMVSPPCCRRREKANSNPRPALCELYGGGETLGASSFLR